MVSVTDKIQRIKRERGVKGNAKNCVKHFRIAIQVELGNFSTYGAGLDAVPFLQGSKMPSVAGA